MTISDSTADERLRETEQPLPEEHEHLAWSQPLIVPAPQAEPLTPIWRKDEP